MTSLVKLSHISHGLARKQDILGIFPTKISFLLINQVTKVIKICSGANLGKNFQLILKQIGLGHLAM